MYRYDKARVSGHAMAPQDAIVVPHGNLEKVANIKSKYRKIRIVLRRRTVCLSSGLAASSSCRLFRCRLDKVRVANK